MVMSRAGKARATGALVALLVVAGCAGRNWTSDHPDVAARAQTDPEGFIEPAVAQWADLVGVAGSYQMRVAKGVGRGSADMAISARRPADLDIVVLGPSGAIEAYLRVNQYEVGLSFAEDRVVYRGPSSGAAFETALGFDLSAADAVAVLLGYGITDADRAGASATWDSKARRVRLAASGVQAWLHPVTQRFDRILHSQGHDTVDARIQSWLPAPPIPDQLRLQVEPDGYRLDLTLSGSPTVNPDFPAGFFDVDVPPGFEVRPLSELAAEGGLFRRAAPTDGAQ
jgi:hypothetical protein